MFSLHWLSFGFGFMFGMMCLSALIVVFLIVMVLRFASEWKDEEEEVVQEGK